MMKLKRSIRIALAVVFLLITAISAKIIFDLNLLPMKLFVRICEGLFIVNFIAAFCLLINKRGFVKVFSFILYFILNIASVATMYYGITTNNFLKNAFGNAEEEYKAAYVILSKNDYTEEDLKG